MTKIKFNVEDNDLIPKRATASSAGYDFKSSEDVTIEPLLQFINKKNFLAYVSNDELAANNNQLMTIATQLSNEGYTYADLADVGEDKLLSMLDDTEENHKLVSMFESYFDMLDTYIKPTLVHTGVKVTMPSDVTLLMFNRSSNPIKRSLILSNGTGVVDADYPGEIVFAFYNLSNQPVTIKKGERIGQGVFTHYLLADDDNATEPRTGGFGSTGVE